MAAVGAGVLLVIVAVLGRPATALEMANAGPFLALRSQAIPIQILAGVLLVLGGSLFLLEVLWARLALEIVAWLSMLGISVFLVVLLIRFDSLAAASTFELTGQATLGRDFRTFRIGLLIGAVGVPIAYGVLIRSVRHPDVRQRFAR
jgi:hypothetical protein